MDDKQIFTALADLEAHLQGINSAKEQVEQVTRSYALVESQFESLQAEMAGVSKNIIDIVDIIKNNQEALNGQIFDMAKARLSAFGSGVEELERKANEIHALFQSDCDKGLKSLNDSTSAAVKSFRGNLDQVNKAQETALAKMIADFQSSIDKYLTAVEKLSVDFKAQLDEFKKKHQQLIEDIHKELTAFNADVSAKLNGLHSEITTSEQSIKENSQNLANSLSSSVQENAAITQQALAAVKDVVIGRIDVIENRQKKIFIFSLVAMIAAFLAIILMIVLHIR